MMRLLECRDGKIQMTRDQLPDSPRYAILSHTWDPDNTQEVTYRDLVDGTGNDKTGYKKIRFCAAQARRDGLQYFWVDTCCIDKTNNTELSEAINSMFRWYRNAARCYCYLSDMSVPGDENKQQSGLAWESAFRAHRWFTRGWTLQELLAPALVEFFTQDGGRLGDKRSLEKQIHEITGIAVLALRGDDLSQFNIEERLKWAKSRQTTREEDWAYCLLGIFGIFMPLIYGEGKANAVRRLRKEIDDVISHDEMPRRQEAKNRTWMVPFERNPSFTDRESELKTLYQMLFTGQQTTKVAITGLGGVGKTQLALELIYRMTAENKDCSVIWIPATSKESLEQAYVNAARRLGISGYEDKKTDVKKLVQDHLSSENAGQWLLVFDNADDVSMWVDKPVLESHRLIDSLPKSRRGSIIFTTRDKKTAARLASRNVVKLSEMDKVSSEELLRNYLINQDLLESTRDATALLDRLMYLPLAIVQAAVYINQNGISLGHYLSLLEEQEEDVIDLLSEDFEDEGRYHDVKNPVATTWIISFEQAQKRDPLAVDYLSFMACVDIKDIPLSLLPPVPSLKKKTDAIGTLEGYSFITTQFTDSTNSADLTINIHRLVHLAMRNWLQKEGLLPSWTGKVTTRLAKLLADAGHDNRAVWRSYMPHAYYTLRSGLSTEDGEEKLDLLWKYGVCLYLDGRYIEAEAPFKQVVEARKTKLGADHTDTLISMVNLASTLCYQGRWDEAEKLELLVMQISKTRLGTDHPDTLTSICNLATTYRNQGRWDKAEKLEVLVMETRRTKLGTNHPDTATSMDNLALTYGSQGRWDEAEKLQVLAMETYKSRLGADHPDTLTSMGNLALTYANQRRWYKAEKLQVLVMETSKAKLGVDHPDTLLSMGNLAATYQNQHQLDKAEKLFVQVVEVRKSRLGADHPDTLTSIGNLASTYASQRRWDEAEKLEWMVMQTSKARLGADHPNTLTSISNLATTYGYQRLWSEAEKLFAEVIETRKTRLGADHPDTLTSMDNLASMYMNQSRWDEAEKLFVRVIETRKTRLGADHPDTLTSIYNLANTYGNQRRWDEVEKLFVQVIEIRKTSLGTDHPDTLTSMNHLALTWRYQGRHVDALALMKDCVQARRQILGHEHPDTLSSAAFVEEWS